MKKVTLVERPGAALDEVHPIRPAGIQSGTLTLDRPGGSGWFSLQRPRRLASLSVLHAGLH